jgi:hypothetical protein
MPLTITTPDPRGLLQDIKRAIDAGSVRTWAYNTKGHFTHRAPQWKEQAWLKPILALGTLQFVIILPTKGEVIQGVESVYQGRFVSMLWKHFKCTAVESSTCQQSALSRRSAPSNRRRADSTAKRGTKRTNNRPKRRSSTK